ncbi:uncharacterized protein LOC128127582 [Lactuca sativa]|uniref:uncharacterized protein LOC128127582 n=1 Tax=Lactuca sativa TaxID=4236 RepID=UPI0022AF5FFD|nr:uncharacterized protein LOC128127582 [Lactuca sativa]
MTPLERRLINASSGGSLGDMTPTEISERIEKLAIESKNSKNKDEWYPDRLRGVKEINNAHLESHISKLTKAVLLTKEKVAAKKLGKTYGGQSLSEPENKPKEEFEEVLVEEEDVKEPEEEDEEYKEVLVEEDKEKEISGPPKPILKEYKTLPPFPSRLKSTKREREDEDIMNFFCKVELAKIFLLFCKNLPPNCKDSGIFSVPCILGNLHFLKAMLDLEASFNFLPCSVFEKLKMGTLQKTGTIIQLANHSILHPKGVLEDVLVRVDNLIFPADFYILDTGNLNTFDENSIILGSSPLFEGFCVFSNVSVQEKFADRNLSYTSEELVEDKLGEVKEEYRIPAVEKSDRILKRNKLLEKEEEELESEEVSDENLKKKNVFEQRKGRSGDFKYESEKKKA